METDSNVYYGTKPSYNASTPTKAADAQYTYTFAGWATSDNATSGTAAANLPNVTGNVTYYAVFAQNTNGYTVTWKNGTGTLETDTDVPYGTKPSYDGGVPAKPADAQYTYTFVGWSEDARATVGMAEEELPNVTRSVTYYAVFTAERNSYTVTFVDYNGTVLKTQTVAYGNAAVAPAKPVREGYNFVGWDKDFSYITGNLIVTAQYVPVDVIEDIPKTGDSSDLALWLCMGMMSIMGVVLLRRKYAR